jgi:hypothetical protein
MEKSDTDVGRGTTGTRALRGLVGLRKTIAPLYLQNFTVSGLADV